jgi:hypothetical protein
LETNDRLHDAGYRLVHRRQHYVNYNNNQYSKFVDVGGGYYHLDCKSSSRALDNAVSTTLDSIITQWTDGGAGNANQNWKLEFVR